MSEFPPSGTDGSPNNTREDQAPLPKISKMAITSMVLGIVGIPLVCMMGLGIPLEIMALVLGILSLKAINKNPQQLGGKGYAIVGLWAGGLGGVLVGLLVWFSISVGNAKRSVVRSVCAANIRGITQSMAVYAAENGGAFPIIAPNGGYGLAAVGSGVSGSDPDATLRSMYLAAPIPSVTQNMWILVLNGQVLPKMFICRSEPANSMAAPIADAAGNFFTNFNDGRYPSDFAYSYSFAYPWTDTPAAPTGNVGGWWKSLNDATLPLMADMAPLAGTGSPAATPGDGRSKHANSFNHERDGQNVGFSDGHAEFLRQPIVGHDNIFTGSNGVPSETGTPPSGKVPDIATGGSAGAWDICLVPAADGNVGYRRK